MMVVKKLYCNRCCNRECDICPVGTWIPSWSRQGCVRKVDDDLLARIHHIERETLPFLRRSRSYDEVYRLTVELESLYDDVFKCDVVHLLDSSGKVDESRKVP